MRQLTTTWLASDTSLITSSNFLVVSSDSKTPACSLMGQPLRYPAISRVIQGRFTGHSTVSTSFPAKLAASSSTMCGPARKDKITSTPLVCALSLPPFPGIKSESANSLQLTWGIATLPGFLKGHRGPWLAHRGPVRRRNASQRRGYSNDSSKCWLARRPELQAVVCVAVGEVRTPR